MRIASKDLSVTFSPNNRKYEISYKGFSWVNEGRPPYVVLRKKVGDKYIGTLRTFGMAAQKSVSCSGNRIVARYGGFTAFGKKLPFVLVCTAEITGENTVEFSLKAEHEEGMDIVGAYFPGPFNAKKPAGHTYAVDTMRQGFLMPDGYQKNFLHVRLCQLYP